MGKMPSLETQLRHQKSEANAYRRRLDQAEAEVRQLRSDLKNLMAKYDECESERRLLVRKLCGEESE